MSTSELLDLFAKIEIEREIGSSKSIQDLKEILIKTKSRGTMDIFINLLKEKFPIYLEILEKLILLK